MLSRLSLLPRVVCAARVSSMVTTRVSAPSHASPRALLHLRASPMSPTHSIMSSRGFILPQQTLFTKAWFSTEKDNGKDEPKVTNENEVASDGSVSEESAESAAPTKEEFETLQTSFNEQQTQLKEFRDRYARLLADMENLRKRTQTEKEDAKNFGIQKFSKDILDVADVLQMAIDNVPQDALEKDGHPHLVALFEGLTTTQKMLDHVFDRHHIAKVHPLNEKFDPNLHEAVFEVPHEHADGLEHGMVAVVQKSGYTLHGRTIRPAAVGVVAKPMK